MMGAAMYFGQYEFALSLLISFMSYLRPTALLNIKGNCLIPPVRGSGTKFWAILVSPHEDNQSTKTHTFDESVLLDWDIVPQLAPLFKQMKNRAGDSGLIWTFTYPVFLEQFHRSLELAGIANLKAHPYNLRHGGASHDSLHRRRSLDEIQKRGHWMTSTSVTRYEKHARVLREAAKMSGQSRKYGMLIEKNLVRLLLKQDKVPAPPGVDTRSRR